MAYEIFISYRRQDTAGYAGRLYDNLVKTFGKEYVLFDEEVAGTAEELIDWVRRVVPDCAVFLALIGNSWARKPKGRMRLFDPDDIVRLEVELAIENQVPIIPLIVGGAQFPSSNEIPKSIQKLIKYKGYELSNSHWNSKLIDIVEAISSITRSHIPVLNRGVEVWNKWRERNPQIIPNLSKAQLQGKDLSNANLNKADLTAANLARSNLNEANLFKANLTDADLTESTLERTQLKEACLSGAFLTYTNLNDANITGATFIGSYLKSTEMVNANLSQTDLTGALIFDSNMTNAILKESNLSGATIRGGKIKNTNFSHCILSNTIFANTDLSECIGLEFINVDSECTLDFRTLKITKNLSREFLKKIGTPISIIDHYLKDAASSELPLYPVFLSHSWANKDFARKLYESLIAKGVNVFFDEKKLKPGDDIFTSLSRGIELYDKTILVCSEESLNSWWVDQELEMVMEKERALKKEIGEKIGLLIPITIDDHIYNWKDGKRMAIRQRFIGDFRNWQDDGAFEKSLNDLVHALNADRPDVKPKSLL
ncbi:MAG: hypothetical protein EPGJADBJ_02929 [Saprospiraceae bacterium]|nr:hypothetical protein [Saprospiraceae bacterium]